MIEKLIVSNWRKFHREREWEFSNGIQLVFGPNTSGKSSILEAIRFAFIGVEKNDPIPNFDVESPTIVTLDFKGTDNNSYRIVRSYKPGKRSVQSFNLYKLDNGNEITVDPGEPINAMSLFGVAPEIFGSILFLREGEIHRSLYKTKSNLSSELASLLNIDRFTKLGTKLNKVAKNYISENLKTYSESSKKYSEKEIKKHNKDFSSLDESIKIKKSELDEIEKKKELIDEKRGIIEEIKEIEDFKIKEGETIKSVREKYKEETETKVGEFLQKEFERKTELRQEFENDINVCQKNIDISELSKTNAFRKLEEIEKLEEHETADCPICKQKLNEDIVQAAKDFYEEEIDQAEENIEKHSNEISNINIDLDKLVDYIDEIEEDMEELENSKKEIERFLTEENDLRDKLKEFENVELEQDFQDNIRIVTEKIEEFLQEQGKIKQILEDYEDHPTDEMEELIFQNEFIKLVVEHIEKHKRTILNNKMDGAKQAIRKKWEDVMSKEVWDIEFDENFLPILKFKETKLSLTALSGSEKLFLSVLMRSFLLDHLMANKTIIQDDPAIHLDKNNLEKLAVFYQDLRNNKHLNQLIITTFDEEFKEILKPDNVISLD